MRRNITVPLKRAILQALNPRIVGDVPGLTFTQGGIAPPSPSQPSDLFLPTDDGGWYDLQLSQAMLTYRRNILDYSNVLTNAKWTKANATVTTGVLDPDGGTTAFTVTATANGGDVRQSVGQVGGGSISVWMRRRTGFGDVQGFTGGLYVSWSGLSTSWQRLSIAMIGDNTQYLMLKLLNAGDAIDVWHPQIEANSGATPTAYQDIATTYPTDWFTTFPNTNLFQDSGGTVPVMAVEQQIGLCLDKSKPIESTPQPTTSWQNENYESFTAVGTGFTAEKTTASGTQVASSLPEFTAVYNQWYKCSINVTKLPVGGVNVNIASGTNQRATNFPVDNIGVTTGYILVTSTTGLTNNSVTVRQSGVGIIEVESITLEAITGNHISQSTGAKRPVLSARQNLLNYSQYFSNAYWTKLNITVEDNVTTTPSGLVAGRLTDNPTLGEHTIATTTMPSGVMKRETIQVKMGTARYMAFGPSIGVTTDAQVGIFDMQAGVWVNSPNPVYVDIQTPISLGDGWWEISFTADSASANIRSFRVGFSSDGTATGTTYSGTGDTFLIAGCQAVYGSEPKYYQRVTTATDYDAVGFVNYTKFDGIDDVLTNTTGDSTYQFTAAFEWSTNSLTTAQWVFGDSQGIEFGVEAGITALGVVEVGMGYGGGFYQLTGENGVVGIPTCLSFGYNGTQGLITQDGGANKLTTLPFIEDNILGWSIGSSVGGAFYLNGTVTQGLYINRYLTAEELYANTTYFMNSVGQTAPPPAFNPDSLFGVNDRGGVFDVNDMSRYYQDFAGLVPVTALGQTVLSFRPRNTDALYVVFDDSGDWIYTQDVNGLRCLSYMVPAPGVVNKSAGHLFADGLFNSGTFVGTSAGLVEDFDTPFFGVNCGMYSASYDDGIYAYGATIGVDGDVYASITLYGGDTQSTQIPPEIPVNGVPSVFSFRCQTGEQTVQVNRGDEFAHDAPYAETTNTGGNIYIYCFEYSRWYGGVAINRYLTDTELANTQQWCADLGDVIL